MKTSVTAVVVLVLVLLRAQNVHAQVIIGQILDYNGQTVSSTERGATVSLYKISPTAAQEVLVNSTTCTSGGQGCVDASGIFLFTTNFQGVPLTAGRYVVLVQGNFLLSRYQEVAFNIPSIVTLALNPVLLLPSLTPCTVTAQKMTCSYSLTRKFESVQQGPATLPMKVFADVATPNITSPNASLSRVDLPTQSVNLGEFGSMVTFAYTFPPGSPSGFTSCLVVRTGADQHHIYREALPRCVVKP